MQRRAASFPRSTFRARLYATPTINIARATAMVARTMQPFAKSRTYSPTWKEEQQTLLFGSGMAAATAAFLALEQPAHVVAPTMMYYGLRQWLVEEAPRYGLEVTFVDVGSPAALKAAIRVGYTKLVWIETPSNPLWTLTDIADSARIAHEGGALLAVDSTVSTPVLTRPLALGADLVLHSASKYLNGHSDVIAGAIVFGRMAREFEACAQTARHAGRRAWTL